MVEFCSEVPGNIIENCSLDTEFLNAVVSPWEAVTGGLFVPLFWAVIIFAVYLRYHAAILSLLIGLPVLVTGAVVLPGSADVVVPLLVVSVVGIGLYFVIHRSPGPVVDDRK